MSVWLMSVSGLANKPFTAVRFPSRLATVKASAPSCREAHHIENLNGKQFRLYGHVKQQVFHKYRRSSCKIEGRVQRHSQIRWITGLALHVALPTLLLAGELFTRWTYYHTRTAAWKEIKIKTTSYNHIHLDILNSCCCLFCSLSLCLTAACPSHTTKDKMPSNSSAYTASSYA
jgi:hypothetical protein